MPTARTLDNEDQANDTQSAEASVERVPKGPPKRARAKPASKSPLSENAKAANSPRKAGERELGVASVALIQARKSASPLLIGAGIGAALALSFVALRPREKHPTVALFASPNATFFNAMVKTVAFAVAQSAAKGSLTSLVARAVGKLAR